MTVLDLLKLNLLNYQNMFESHGMKLGIQICLDEINKISSADVVEVVRCKDCIYGELIDGKNGKTDVWCDFYRIPKSKDGFCDCFVVTENGGKAND